MGLCGGAGLGGCWCGGVQVFEWVLVWKGTGGWVGVGVEGYRCLSGCGGVEVFEWVLVWRGRGV